MRKLAAVIEQILEVAPDLEPQFKSLQESIMYTAPEAMQMRWQQAMDILNDCAVDHPNVEKIGAIFGGEEKNEN